MRVFLFLELFLQKLLPKKWRKSLARVRLSIYWFLSWCGKPYFYYRQSAYKKVIARLSNNEKFEVLFFVFQDSIWKYETLYRFMEAHPRFNPLVVVIPFTNYGFESMFDEMEKTYQSFKTKGYNVVKSYNSETKKYISVKTAFNPDIVFFSTPHRLTPPDFQVGNFLDCLTAYVPYGIMSVNMEEEQYNQLFHNLVWRCYYETPIHSQIAKKFSRIKAMNVVVTGYPLADVYLDNNYQPKDVWKNPNTGVKRIIWAPHHTLEANASLYSYSTFLFYAELFPQLLDQYQGKIQMAFKPHPILKLKLYNHPDWGKERTDAYFRHWETAANCQLEEGEYNDLFLTSDALIHDSISFISEYCYTGKPSLFTVRDNKVSSMFNSFGKQAFQMSYMAYNEIDIKKFIENVVINEQDSMKNTRRQFVDEFLRPPFEKTVAENIVDDLLQALLNK